jgi:hypothetical protein
MPYMILIFNQHGVENNMATISCQSLTLCYILLVKCHQHVLILQGYINTAEYVTVVSNDCIVIDSIL